jgi:hypothetical protein
MLIFRLTLALLDYAAIRYIKMYKYNGACKWGSRLICDLHLLNLFHMSPHLLIELYPIIHNLAGLDSIGTGLGVVYLIMA